MNSTASRRHSWMVCTWHLPVRGKVEKRKHMDRASSRSRSASTNVGYLHGRGGGAQEAAPPGLPGGLRPRCPHLSATPEAPFPTPGPARPPPSPGRGAGPRPGGWQHRLPCGLGRNHGTRTSPLSSEGQEGRRAFRHSPRQRKGLRGASRETTGEVLGFRVQRPAPRSAPGRFQVPSLSTSQTTRTTEPFLETPPAAHS